MPKKNGEVSYLINRAISRAELSTAMWYGVRVRFRSELLVASLLAAKDIECFVPCFQQRRAFSDRVRNVALAAFPGYIFCRIEATDRLRVLNTAGVQGLAGPRQCPEAIEEETISALRTAFSRPSRVAEVPYLACGERVRVLNGPMAGASGIFVRTKGKQRLVISLPILQRSVEVEVDGASVISLSETNPGFRQDAGRGFVPSLSTPLQARD